MASNVLLSPGSFMYHFSISALLLTTTLASNIKIIPSGSTLSKKSELHDSDSCKVFPGDKDWPDDATWAHLNESTGHALIKTVPIGSACHSSWPQYDASQCTNLLQTWANPETFTSNPTAIMYSYFQGLTCIPTTNYSSPCTIGGFPSYVVNISNPYQISTAIKFAREKNIRLVIKNTGHDVAGKSTGAGALSIWTHHLKSLEFIENYVAEGWTGPVIRAGAGVELEELYRKAKENEVTAVGGECTSVGFAGGYFSAGGHSPLGGLWGMGADQVVALSAVLPDGTEVNITQSGEPELFWAFRGGGGSTFGVVTSVTVRVYPKIPVTIHQFQFTTSASLSSDTFWRAMRTYYDYFIPFADAGTQGFAFVTNTTDNQLNFLMRPLFAPNMSIPGYKKLTAPFFKQLDELGVTFIPNITSNLTYFDNFYDAWALGFPKLGGPYSDIVPATGSRLFPRANWENPTLLNETFSVIKAAFIKGHRLVIYNSKNLSPPGVTNAVNPAWRKSVSFTLTSSLRFYVNSTVEEINRVRDELTNGVLESWRSVSRGSGTYMNEADVREPDFQQSFFGSNYERLLGLKRKLDPEGVFYAPLAVGSEFWEVQDVRGLSEVQNGKLCRKK